MAAVTAPYFNVVVMDPPWAERGGGKIKRGADRHYPLVATRELPHVIMGADVWRPADSALLWCWATEAFLGDALWLIGKLGFRKVSGFVWVKFVERGTLDDGSPLFTPPARLGLGQWTRCEHEHLLLARRGDLVVPPPKFRSRSVIAAPRGAHSEKPEAAWRIIERTSLWAFGGSAFPTADGRVEMFSRAPARVARVG